MSVVRAAIALVLAAGTAFAQAPEPVLRPTSFELRQTLDDELDSALRQIADARGANRRADGATLASVLAQQGCAAAPDVYWSEAIDWMASNATPRLVRGARIVAGPYQSDLRRQIDNVAESIDGRAPKRFLADNDRADARPADIAAALRQRAEWATAMPTQVVRVRATQESDPTSLRYALALSVWTRGLCVQRAGHAAVARAALDQIGYPDAARHGEKTELAFAVLVAASGDRSLATNALVAGGDGISAPARRLIGDASQRATP